MANKKGAVTKVGFFLTEVTALFFYPKMQKNDARGIEPGAYMVKCNCQGTFTMNYFTTKQGVLFYDYTIEVEQTSKIDRFLELLESSGVAELLAKESSSQLSGRPEIDPFRLFACILYGFAMGSSSLRELETSCRYDTSVGVHPLTKIWVHRKQPNLFHGATKRYKRKRQP